MSNWQPDFDPRKDALDTIMAKLSLFILNKTRADETEIRAKLNQARLLIGEAGNLCAAAD